MAVYNADCHGTSKILGWMARYSTKEGSKSKKLIRWTCCRWKTGELLATFQYQHFYMTVNTALMQLREKNQRTNNGDVIVQLFLSHKSGNPEYWLDWKWSAKIWKNIGTFPPVRYSGFGIRDWIYVFGIQSISRFKKFPGYLKA